MSLSRTMPFMKRFESLFFDIDLVPFPATWDGDTKREEKEEAALSSLTALLETNLDQYAAIIIEPLLQGVGGMRMCTDKFMRSLEALSAEANLLTIYDEALTGFGRTGDWFACSKARTSPDIICLAKGLTGGFLPLALTVASDEIYQSFYSDDLEKAFFHSHSYMGNPLACAAANASLRLLERNPDSFTKMETLHRGLIQKWLVGNKRLNRFRVLGTIAAFEVVSEEGDRYFNSLGVILRQKFLDQGILLRPLGNTIYILPPYCITTEELESAYQTINQVVDSL